MPKKCLYMSTPQGWFPDQEGPDTLDLFDLSLDLDLPEPPSFGLLAIAH
jgi:hypothetical protein